MMVLRASSHHTLRLFTVHSHSHSRIRGQSSPIRLHVAHSPFSDPFPLILLTEWVMTDPCRLMKKDDIDENETLVDLDCPKRHE